MRRFFLYLLSALVVFTSYSQTIERPKLIVGIVVDQMRWDYLYLYSSRYGKDGFKKLLREGFSCENTFIPYTPTYTAAGHACVYTGSMPALNGIIGNNWYSRELNRRVYCTDDNEVQGVGSNSSAGKMSPKNLWSNTITDELRMATNFKSKTIAIALKDRGAILPGGHTANAAYWFDNATGGWISSSFYMSSLPAWVNAFNNKKLPDAYLQQNWKTLYPINSYLQSTADNKSYETRLPGEDNSFPHQTDSLRSGRYESFRHTPFGNTYTFEMAKAAVENERLGSGGASDFLAISLSSTDYIGHAFGPNSIEVEDTYLRLDRDIAVFLNYLDAKLGKGGYLVFLTADHGVAHIPGYAKENKMPAGLLDDALISRVLNDSLQKQFKVPGLVEDIINYQVYLNTNLLRKNSLDKRLVKHFVIGQLLKYNGMAGAYDLEEISGATIPNQLKMMLVNGYNQKLSGDVQFIFKPQWFDGGSTGTTHGLWNPYDAHIPLLWYGWNIKPGKTNREVYMSDIAPTLAALLQIQMPNASVGKVIEEIERK